MIMEAHCTSNCVIMESLHGGMHRKWKTCSDLKVGQNKYLIIAKWLFGIYY